LITGNVQLDLKKLPYLRGSKMNVAIRKAQNKAAAPVKAALIAAAPSDSGLLKKSIKIKVKYYAGSKTWAAIVGPSKAFKRMRKRKPKLKQSNSSKLLGRLKTAAAKKAKKLRKLAARKAKTLIRKAKLGRRLLRSMPKSATVAVRKSKRRKRRAFKSGQVQRPARYAHIANWGSKKMRGGKFLERTLASSSQRYQSILSQALKQAIAEILS
jgi:HK97 gp10 family phage protein